MWSGLPASEGLPISTSTPTNPIASESHSRAVGLLADAAPSTPTHSGIVAHTTATPPTGSDCEAIETKPLPPTNSSTPTGATRSQSRSAGHARRGATRTPA